jgi:hypothetical protein
MQLHNKKIEKMKRDLTNYHNFLWWIKSDNVIKVGANEYRTQCSQYSISMNRKEAYIYFKRNYSM